MKNLKSILTGIAVLSFSYAFSQGGSVVVDPTVNATLNAQLPMINTSINTQGSQINSSIMQTNQKLDQLDSKLRQLNSTADKIERSNDKIEKSNDKVEKSNDKVEKSNDKVEKSNDKVEKMAKTKEKSQQETAQTVSAFFSGGYIIALKTSILNLAGQAAAINAQTPALFPKFMDDYAVITAQTAYIWQKMILALVPGEGNMMTPAERLKVIQDGVSGFETLRGNVKTLLASVKSAKEAYDKKVAARSASASKSKSSKQDISNIVKNWKKNSLTSL